MNLPIKQETPQGLYPKGRMLQAWDCLHVLWRTLCMAFVESLQTTPCI